MYIYYIFIFIYTYTYIYIYSYPWTRPMGELGWAWGEGTRQDKNLSSQHVTRIDMRTSRGPDTQAAVDASALITNFSVKPAVPLCVLPVKPTEPHISALITTCLCRNWRSPAQCSTTSLCSVPSSTIYQPLCQCFHVPHVTHQASVRKH